ncbi:hypothetical protein [Herminiimonas contaminans]|uniref:Bacteriophage lambda head decoration protein D n=1 Tax=Herminiimonas contaminans TaxID=1111140 RepID=A0ABS0ET69_9BURK|nr:hypothetical protein [Herminiimonas contaminans]MBF8177239.1 hypothetical protein [Herminiimonas contaminans]
MSSKILSLGSAGSAVQGILISGATNATPIVLTLAAGHGLKNGDRLAVAGITGNTGANGEFTLANVTGTTATLLGSAGNGTYGGTPRAAVICDVTPHMKDHSAALVLQGNLVGTLDIESYASYADFAAGVNTSPGAIAPVVSPSIGTNSAGSGSAPAKTTITAAATNAALCCEVKLAKYMRAVVTAYTSGTVIAALEA